MKGIFALIACLALMTVLGTSAVLYVFVVKPRLSSAGSDKFAALKELRDSGAISSQEYDTRAHAASAGAPASSSGPSMISSVAAAFTGARKVEISDPAYQTVAYTMEIPGDWKFAGEIARPPGCHSNGAALRLTAQSPDGMTAAVVLPSVTWSWSTDENIRKIAERNHCPGIDIDTAASFLVNIAIPNIRPNAKVVEVLPLLPEGQAGLKDQLAKQQEMSADAAQRFGNKPPKVTLDGARVRIQYEREGHPVEEMVGAVIQCNETIMPHLPNQPENQLRICTTRGTQITRAPKGHLDEELASAQIKNMGASLKANPDWQNRMLADQVAGAQRWMADNNRQFQANLQQNQKNFEAMQQRAKQFDANLRASTDHAIAADRQRQAAIDASAHATALYSLDRQEFRNPNTGQIIEASNQYNHQWISSDGSTLIQTDSHTYDPNGRVYPVSQSWTELVAK